MITTVVISKDKPAQLHLLIDSLQKYGSNLFNITVLFEASSEHFLDGYKKAQEHFYRKSKRDHTFPIRWKERNGLNLSLQIIECGMSKGDLICLLNDENILFGYLHPYKLIKKLFDLNSLCCLSLRLGNNTIIQNAHDREDYFVDLPSEGEFLYDSFLVWDATKINPYTNFAIPFSTDGHVYHKNVLFNVLGRVPVEEYESFEHQIQQTLYSGAFENHVPPLMSCLEYSKVIRNSASKISDKVPNELGVSLETINERYLRGSVIDHSFFNFNVHKPHQDFIVRFIDG